MKFDLSPNDIQTLEYACHIANQYYIKTGLTLEKNMLSEVTDKIAKQKSMGGAK